MANHWYNLADKVACYQCDCSRQFEILIYTNRVRKTQKLYIFVFYFIYKTGGTEAMTSVIVAVCV